MDTPLAVEFSERTLKAVLSKRGLPSAAAVEPVSDWNDEAAVSRAVQSVLRALGVRKGARVSICVPRSSVTLRTLALPSQDPSELAKMAELQAAKIVPYKKSEMVHSFREIARDQAGHTRILLAILQLSLVRRQIAFLEKAGLSVDAAVLSSSLGREWAAGLSAPPPGDTHALLDADAHSVDFIVYDSERLCFSRAIAFRPMEGEPEWVRLIGEIKQSLVIFMSEESGQRPSRLWLTGIPEMTALGARLQEDLEIPAARIDSPADRWKLAVPPSVSGTAVAQLTRRSSGARIEFLLPEIQIRRQLRDNIRQIMAAGSVAFILLSIVTFGYLGGLYQRGAYLSKLKERNAAYARSLGSTIEQAKKLDLLQRVESERRWPLTVVALLEKAVSADVRLTAIRIEPDSRTSIRGEAAELSSALRFIAVLEKHKALREVTTKSTRTKKAGNREITDFEVTFLPAAIP